MKFTIPAIACTLLIMTCFGCGKSVDLGVPIEVTGVVTLDGQPLDKATVGFVAISQGLPPEHRYVSAVTDATGNFSIAQAYPAEYAVTLNQAASVAETAPAVEHAAVAGSLKLAKYSADSPLRAKVSKENTTFKFAAESSR